MRSAFPLRSFFTLCVPIIRKRKSVGDFLGETEQPTAYHRPQPLRPHQTAWDAVSSKLPYGISDFARGEPCLFPVGKAFRQELVALDPGA